jgi:hypothetical protein
MGGRGGVLEGVAQGVGAGLGANMGGRGGMRQPANPNFQQQFEDMRRGFEVTDREMGGMYDQMRELGYGPQQPGGLANGAAQGFAQGFGGGQPTGIISDEQARSIGQNFGGGFGDMQGQANGFAQGFGRGFGGGMGGQQPSLEQQARSRAEAIARGDMVTMDYNPQREEMVNQFLGQMGRGPAMNPQMKQPGTVSGTLQRGPMQRPNPFASMIGKKPMPL